MQLAAVLLCVLAVVTLCGKARSDDMVVISRKCGKEFSVTPEYLENLQNAHLDDIKPSIELMCFTKCVFTGLDVVKNNTLNTEKVKKLYAVLEDKPDVKDIAEKCKDTYNGADTCDEAWEMFKCYMDFDRE